MKKMIPYVLIWAAFTILDSRAAYGQASDLMEDAKKSLDSKKESLQDKASEKSTNGKDRVKKKLNKKGKNKKTSSKKDSNTHPAIDKLKEKIKESIFPSWPVPGFDWSLDPVAGFETRTYYADDTETSVATTELGLRASLKGLPFMPTNPGVTSDVMVGGTFGASGNYSQKTAGSSEETELDGYTYKRYWGGLGFTILYHQFKNRIQFRRGILTPSTDDRPVVTSNGITNDFGILIFSWISGHYTLGIDRVFLSTQDDTFLSEVDHWLHVRFFTDFLKAYFDIGPGYTDSEQIIAPSGADGLKTTTKQSTSYFLALAGLNPFWKFVAKMRAKYVLDSSGESILGGDLQLPEQDLNQPTDTGIPADSLVSSLFVGLENIFGGFGIGYQVNLSVYNMSEKDGKKKETIRQDGFAVAYTANF